VDLLGRSVGAPPGGKAEQCAESLIEDGAFPDAHGELGAERPALTGTSALLSLGHRGPCFVPKRGRPCEPPARALSGLSVITIGRATAAPAATLPDFFRKPRRVSFGVGVFVASSFMRRFLPSGE
jgi:hypothetical protein